MGRVLEKRQWKYLGHALRKRGSVMAVTSILGWEPVGQKALSSEKNPKLLSWLKLERGGSRRGTC